MDQAEGKGLGKSNTVMLQKKKEGGRPRTKQQTVKWGMRGTTRRKSKHISLTSFLDGKYID